jgi:hypothetical protein
MALALAPLLAAGRPAQAVTLTFSFSFPLGFAPEAVAYGPDTEDAGGQDPGRLFVAENSSGGLGDNTLHVFDLGGSETRSFVTTTTSTTAPFDEIRGLDYRPDTQSLLISTNERFSGGIPSRVREIDLAGADVPGGIDFTVPDFEPEATFFHDDRGTVFVADEEGPNEIGTIQEFLVDGTPGDGTDGVFFEVAFATGPFDDPNGMDFLGDFVLSGDDNSGGASRLDVFDLNGTSVFTSSWLDLTDLDSTSQQTVDDCAAAPDPEDECVDFEGMTIDLIDVGQGPELHLVAVFEDQEMLIAWKLGDLPEPPASVPGLPVPEPGSGWLLGAVALGLARLATR